MPDQPDIVLHTAWHPDKPDPPQGFVVTIHYDRNTAEDLAALPSDNRKAIAMAQEQATGARGWMPDMLVLGWQEQVDGSVHLHEVTVPTLVEIDDAGPYVVLHGKRIRVRPRGWMPQARDMAGTTQWMDDSVTWLQEKVSKRNRDTARVRMMAMHGSIVPSGMLDMVAGAFPKRTSDDRRQAIVSKVVQVETKRHEDAIGNLVKSETKVVVAFDDLSRERIANHSLRRRGKRAGAALGQVLAYDQVTVPASNAEIAHAAIGRLSWFDIGTLRTLWACMHLAYERGGWFPAAVSEVAKAIGIDPKSMQGGVRAEIKEDLRMLEQVEIRISPVGHSNVQHVRLPLLQRYGSARLRGVRTEVALWNVHPVLWQPVTRGIGVMADPRILTANLQTQEWHLRLYLHVAGGWSLGWVANQSLRQGGPSRYLLTDLLNGAGIDWHPLLTKHGLPWLLERIRGTLQDLEQWPTGPLIGSWRLDAGGSIELCRVEIAPPAGLATALTAKRKRLLDVIDADRLSDA